MLKSLRRHIMMQQGGGLPSEYTRVDYLDMMLAYIRMPDILVSEDLVFKGRGKFYQANTGSGYFLSTNGQPTYRLLFNDYFKTFFASGYGGGGPDTMTVLGNLINTDLDFELKKGLLTLNGAQITLRVMTGSEQMREWGIGNNSYIIFRGLVVENSNGILVNLVPCYRNSDMVCGVYDTVSHEFVTKTTGTITYGYD